LLFQETLLKHTDKNHIIAVNFEDAEFDSILTYRDLNSYRLKNDRFRQVRGPSFVHPFLGGISGF
jgi:hypothetical protein